MTYQCVTRRNHRNALEYMGLFGDYFQEFIDDAQKRAISEVSKRCAITFGENLDASAYDILKSVQDRGWRIKIKAHRGTVTHLYIGTQTPKMEFPYEICQLTSLKELVVRATNFGVILGGLPENIGDLVNLEVFDMKNTRITTKLPFSMVKMHKLRTINFTHNVVFTDIPHQWFWRRNGSEEKAARIIQNAWRGKYLQEGADVEYPGEIPGPLRFPDSRINIWERVGFRGYPDNYVGSILEMPTDKRTTPYIWIDDDDYDEDEDEETNEKCGKWIRMPLLMRSMRMRPVKMWYGVEYM